MTITAREQRRRPYRTLLPPAVESLENRLLLAATPIQLADIVSGAGSSNPQDLVRVGDDVFFTAQTAQTGRELWKTNGTPEGTTLVKDIWSGPSGSRIEHLVAVGDSLFFSANDGSNGRELWKSDGSADGTLMVKDIWAGTDGSSPTELTAVGERLFFSAADGDTGLELWTSNGSTAGTTRVTEIEPGQLGSSPTFLTEFNGQLLFSAFSLASGREPWISDGTDEGTFVLGIEPGNPGSAPRDFTVVGEEAYFVATSAGVGAELFKTDGTPVGTQLVRDIGPAPLSSEPHQLLNVGGTLLFVADDGFTGHELWRSDGTADGTLLVKDIHPGIAGSGIQALTEFHGLALFAADDFGAAGHELWKSDGSSGGTGLLKDINPGDATSEMGVEIIVSETGLAFFGADDGIHGTELWCTDGKWSGTELVTDVYAGLPPSSPADLVELSGKIVFVATTDLGREPWVVSTNRSPVADAGGPYFAQAGDPVISLDATASSDPEDNIVTYTWDLDGDGIFGDLNGPTPSLSWSELISVAPHVSTPGTHEIYLKVIDEEDLEDESSAWLQTDVNFPYTDESLVLYHALTGTLALDFHLPVSEVTLYSESGVFTTPVPGAETSTRYEIKLTDPGRLADFSLFGVLPPGLTPDSLTADLRALALDMDETPLPLVKLATIPDGTADALVTYDAVNGGIGGASTVPMTTLQIRSASEMFHGPCEHMESDFDWCSSHTLFKLAEHGIYDVYFGEVAPIGLTSQTVSTDLALAGSKLPQGALSFSLVHISALQVPIPIELFLDTGQLLGQGRTHDADLADLDDDGDLDAFITHDRGEGDRVWMNDGFANFVDSGQSLGSSSSIYAALGDVDGDGDFDAFVATRQANVVWLNDGHGLFVDSGQRLGQQLSIDVALGDLDDDDDLDAYVTNLQGQPDEVWLNNGQGEFFDSGLRLGNLDGKSVELGDLDGDGDLDAFVGNEDESQSAPNQVWLNDGHGVLTDSGQRLGSLQTQHVALGDLDADGDLDAIEAGTGPNNIWFNDGQAVFSESDQVLTSSSGSHITLGDLDNDGDLDAFFSNWFSRPDTVWLNRGNGSFFSTLQPLGSATSSHTALGDLDGDGDLDAFVAEYNERNRVYENLTTTVNRQPIAEDDLIYATDENTALAVPLTSGLLLNDHDPNRDPLHVSAFDNLSTQEATITVAADGSFTYDPTDSVLLQGLSEGTIIFDTFDYFVSDSGGLADEGRVRITVTGRNDGPTADDEEFEFLENDPIQDLTATLLDGDDDADNSDVIRISSVDTAGTVGIVTLADGVVTYQPGPGFDPLRIGEEAADRFTYTVSDQLGANATAMVVISVTGETDSVGDFDGDALIDVNDIDMLCEAINHDGSDPLFDLNQSGVVSLADLDELIWNVLGTSFGDANLDGSFNSSDLVQAFQAGDYEDGIEGNSNWIRGDWNCDREFDSSDLVKAFQGGTYEQPAPALIAASLDGITRVSIARQPSTPARRIRILPYAEPSRRVAVLLDRFAADLIFGQLARSDHSSLTEKSQADETEDVFGLMPPLL